MNYLLLADNSAIGYQIHDSELMEAKSLRNMLRRNVNSHLVKRKPKNMV